MSTSRDGNFLIGDDHLTERLQREARQLHLSKFSRIRSEAHFARYRNSFLKCDLDQTNDRIEQGRKLRLAELERKRVELLKEEKNRRKIRRKSRDLFIEKQTREDPTSAAVSRDENLGLQDKQCASGFNIASSSPSRATSVEEDRELEGRHESTSATKPRVQVTSSMSFGDDLGSSDGRTVHVNKHANHKENSSDTVLTESSENNGGGLGSEGCNGRRGHSEKRLSVANSSSSRSSDLTGERRKKKNPSVSVLISSLASSVTRDYIALRNNDKRQMSVVAGKQENQLNVASLSPPWAPSGAGKREFSGKQDKRLSIATPIPSRMSAKAGKQDLAGKDQNQLSVAASSSSSRASSVAGKQNVTGKHVQATGKRPSLRVTPSIDVAVSDRRNSFGSNPAIVEKVEQRKNSLASSAKSLRDFGPSRAEKTAETDHENESDRATKESKSRIHSALSSEVGSEAISRISRRSRRIVTPALTEFQETSTKKAQTRSAHEKWIWTEFDKIMKGFADVLRIEHKSVNLKNANAKSEGVMEKDVKPANTQHNPMTPLYFRFGISDRIVFRC